MNLEAFYVLVSFIKWKILKDTADPPQTVFVS